MQRETSNDSFLDYGSVYHQPIDHEYPLHRSQVAHIEEDGHIGGPVLFVGVLGVELARAVYHQVFFF